MRTTLFALLSAPAFLAAQQAPAAAGPADRHLALVRARFSGERALETVAYMDHYVRWPGNAGFDSSIANVARRLAAAGYVEAASANPTDRLTYRVERYPLPNAAWEPLDASLSIVGADGRTTLVLAFATNRNMLASNSFSTPEGGVEAELVRVAAPTAAALDAVNVRGKIVVADGALGALFTQAVVNRGAVGAIAYGMPAYTQPERNTHSIQFTSIPDDSARKGWGIRLSYGAREQLNAALEAERKLSADTLARGGSAVYESHIIETWSSWYRSALKTADDIEAGGSSDATRATIAGAVNRVQDATAQAVASLKGKGD